MVRMRRDVSTLVSAAGEWADTLVWYARAVERMTTRLIADPTSWRYQAAIHAYVQGADPYATAGDVLPTDVEQEKFWNQCQHNSWFFLPWHRWYLHYFEEIVAAAINDLGGPGDTWALPYWNYSANPPDSRRLPVPFISETLPNSSEANPLYIPFPNRRFGNDGEPVGSDFGAALDCLQQRSFEATTTDVGFGGPKTGFNHNVGQELGALEWQPHGTMHGAVNGFMGRFHTAALDPLFWLHHCNIDRLWVVWRELDSDHRDPSDTDWLDRIEFDFNDGRGNVVSRTSREAVDTTELGYQYDHTPEEGPALLNATGSGEVFMTTDRIPEMVGASEGPTALTNQPTTATVNVSAPTGPALLSADEAPQRFFIRIENVTGTGEPRPYNVYVNGEFAGIIPLFGVAEATEATEKHGGGGLHYRLDITKLVNRLKAEGKWDDANVSVTFEPDEKQVANEVAVLSTVRFEEPSAFQVGRVSVFVA